jgi:hypothetical protein
MPLGERRPADVNARAVMIAKIATGEIKDVTIEDGKNAAAVALGRMGGKARAESMTAKRRKEIAKNAASRGGERNNWPVRSKTLHESKLDARMGLSDPVHHSLIGC